MEMMMAIRKRLSNDVRTIRNSDKVFVSADKTNNLYKVSNLKSSLKDYQIMAVYCATKSGR